MMLRNHAGTGYGDFNFGFLGHPQTPLFLIHRKGAKCAEKSYFMFAVDPPKILGDRKTANMKDNAAQRQTTG
jgi:hypothetical protein